MKPDFLEWHGITQVYAAKGCFDGNEPVASGMCDDQGIGYCFDGNWYVSQDPGNPLPDGSTPPAWPK
jgi:hypothetical protein